MRFAGALRAHADGVVAVPEPDGALSVRGADRVTLLVTGATDYDRATLDVDRDLDPEAICYDRLAALSGAVISDLRAHHVDEHTEWMDRVALDLGGSDTANAPTDVRLDAVKNGADDLGLVELYFQYGRYLLADSSKRPGQLPANLQGIWCKDRFAPWGSDYHTNINLQMNYWHAGPTNLCETNAALVHFVDRLRIPGRITARSMYGAEGWTLHHDTDVFGRTGLHDGIHWGTFPMGGPWTALMVWDRYAFDPDRRFLEATGYPILRESAEFVMTFLFDDGGRLVSAPSYSPENAFLHPTSGKPTQLTHSPTMDLQIARELLHKTVEAAEILSVDRDLCDRIRSAISRLPPTRISPDGTIAEWIEDYAEAEPGHRHISHLFGLHPGSQIGPADPELFAAARRTIEKRLANGGGHTGWSRAWIANFYARLLDGDAAAEHLALLLANSTLPNLFDDHPPFQIDGNFGGTAAIAEMLLQSHRGVVDLLPALPARWARGRVTGLVARGGFEIDIGWDHGALTDAAVRSRYGGPCTLSYRGTTARIDTERGAEYRVDSALSMR
jgi:alpha-L-fucosidase 2